MTAAASKSLKAAAMTDRTPQTASAAAGATRRRPRALPTVLASVACFLVLFEFLAFRLTSGHDPALGTSAPVTAATQTRPTVIHRRIVNTKVVSLPPKSSGSSTSMAIAAPASTAAPATSSATPAPVAAPAPAPAPAPASPVTSSS